MSILSLGSIEDAKGLAKNLGIRFELLPIHDVFGQYQQVLKPLFAGMQFGLAEENLQSRIRGALLMALSNKFGSLVLTTGNKSEMAVGYCTLYGDMVGALAVIGDVMKTKVYALSRYANREREVIPRATIEKAPSAELRPEQRDTDSLPPYDVLDLHSLSVCGAVLFRRSRLRRIKALSLHWSGRSYSWWSAASTSGKRKPRWC